MRSLGHDITYWQFIQDFSKIVALFIFILNIIKSANKSVSGKNNGKNKFDEYVLGSDDIEYVKK